MNKKFKTSKIVLAVAILLAGFMHFGAFAQSTITQLDPFTLSTNIDPHIGVYYALAKMTNSAGQPWITPSNGVSSCTFQDASGLSSPPYAWSVIVTRHIDGVKWYTNNNNSLTFPVTNSTSYQFVLYVNNPPPPPTNGQPLTLQAQFK